MDDTLNGLVARHASAIVRALHSAPGSAPLPAHAHAHAHAHEIVVAVAALLAAQYGGAVTLNTYHEVDAYTETDNGFGCGCSSMIVGNGEAYDFHRSDSEWSLSGESDGRKLSDGSTVFQTWEILSTPLGSARSSSWTTSCASSGPTARKKRDEHVRTRRCTAGGSVAQERRGELSRQRSGRRRPSRPRGLYRRSIGVRSGHPRRRCRSGPWWSRSARCGI